MQRHSGGVPLNTAGSSKLQLTEAEHACGSPGVALHVDVAHVQAACGGHRHDVAGAHAGHVQGLVGRQVDVLQEQRKEKL